MITELTEEQKKMIPVYVEKWAKIGLSCEPVKDYEETINLFYEKVLNKKRLTKIILAPSPLQRYEQLWGQINNEVWQQVWEQLWKHVGERVRVQVWEQIGNLVKLIGSGYFGQLAFCNGAFFDYLNHVLDIQYPENWVIYKKTEELGLTYMFDDICIISDRPEQISMKNGVLHNESGMAIKYRDGWGVYYLNGVRVTKEIVETPADKLDPEIILKESDIKVKREIIRKIRAESLEEIVLKETNAEIRREIIRKIGVERLEKKLKPLVLDKWGDYELHDYSKFFPEMRCRPVYLKMKNPSIGVWHYEGVNIDEMEAPTCQAALKWRLKGKDFKPIRIT